MTLAELSALSDDQLNVMLAECEGWTVIQDEHGIAGTIDGTKWQSPEGMPRYTQDLNETARVEEGLPSGIRDVTYISTLAKVCGFAMYGPEEWSNLHQGRAAVAMAKPRQRTIALIAVKKGIK